MTLFNDSNLTAATDWFGIVDVVNREILGGFYGWGIIIIIFAVLYTITSFSRREENRFSYATIGTATVGIFLVAMGFMPAYALWVFVVGVIVSLISLYL